MVIPPSFGASKQIFNYHNKEYTLNIYEINLNDDSFRIEFKIKSSTNILIREDGFCLRVDSNNIYFGNALCLPFYFNTVLNNKYIYIPKDSTIILSSNYFEFGKLSEINVSFLYLPFNKFEMLVDKPIVYFENTNGQKTLDVSRIIEEEIMTKNLFSICKW